MTRQERPVPRLGRDSLAPGALLGASAPPRSGIVHLGLGNFHRAHAAVYTALAMREAGGDWGIHAFANRSERIVSAMREQDGMYALLQLSNDVEAACVVDVHRGLDVAAAEPERFVAAIGDEANRVLTLTVSELGYSRNAQTGGLDLDAEAVRADLRAPSAARTAIGMIARGLERRAAGGAPFTVLSCDNLQASGDATRDLVIEFLHAAAAPAQVLDYVESGVAFPNSMVDRIAPLSSDDTAETVARLLGVRDESPVRTEEFTMWVLEDRFAAGRPAWELVGAQFTDEVEAYEIVKLRMLNGSYSLLAYLGVLAGHATIPEAWSRDFVREAVMTGIFRDYLPSIDLPTGFDPEAYAASLSERWSNTALSDLTLRVGSDGSGKLPQRVPEAALHALDAGRMPHLLALTLAAWIATVAPPAGFAADALSERVVEPARETLRAAVRSARTPLEHVRAVMAAGFFPSALAQREEFARRVAELLGCIAEHGVEAAAREAVSAGDSR